MDQEEVTKKSQPFYVIAAGLLIAVITIAFLMSGDKQPEPVAIKPTPAPVTPEPVIEEIPDPAPIEEEPVIEEPEVTEIPETVTLDEPEPVVNPYPELQESDNWVKTQIFELAIDLATTEVIGDADLISNFVVFVDNAAKGDVVTSFSPVKEPMSKFKAIPVANSNEAVPEYILDPESYRRYDNYVNLISSLTGKQSKALYDKVHPLIEEAYQQLGYSNDDFDDKLADTKDILLDTPIVEGEVDLVAPSAMFKFADPELENLLPIQKLLLRMGPDNQRKVQAALARFRKQL
jgi:hypothetical protein